MSSAVFTYNETWFWFEESFDQMTYRAMMLNNRTLVLSTVALYLLFAVAGPRYMKSRTAFDLQRSLFLWNSFMCVFSLMGAIRTCPEFWHTLSHNGLHATVCSRSYADSKVSGTWGWLFAVSKVAEMVDTLFVVLRKRPLVALQWYHHSTAALAACLSFPDMPSTARVLMNLNYAVHSLMYFYYAVRANGVKTPKSFSLCVTCLQILQLFIGTVVAFYALFSKVTGGQCDISNEVATGAAFTYFTVFLMFAQFFRRSYLTTPTEGAKKIS